jgi:GMP synthase-like glutamine amidotransferase
VAGFSNWNAPNGGIGPFKDMFPFSRGIMKYTDMDFLDVIFLWGGADISPSLYNQERIYNSGPIEPSGRDQYEWEVIREARKRGIPIIGICRGAQMLCAAAGGTLIQHVGGHNNFNHFIETSNGQNFTMPGDHHQMMYPYDVEHELLAWVPNKISTEFLPKDTPESNAMYEGKYKEPEAVWFPKIKGLAIQGHPEWNASLEAVSWCEQMIKEYCLVKSKV